jgi:hypothetical protein
MADPANMLYPASHTEPLDWFDRNCITEMRPGMGNRKKVVFLTADHLEEQADARQ